MAKTRTKETSRNQQEKEENVGEKSLSVELRPVESLQLIISCTGFALAKPDVHFTARRARWGLCWGIITAIMTNHLPRKCGRLTGGLVQPLHKHNGTKKNDGHSTLLWIHAHLYQDFYFYLT